MKSFGPKKFQISSTVKKVPFWQFFRMGWDGRALKNPSQELKKKIVLGANKYIERLEGKITECLFFYVKIF
jgi:hypothetical protein